MKSSRRQRKKKKKLDWQHHIVGAGQTSAVVKEVGDVRRDIFRSGVFRSDVFRSDLVRSDVLK